MDDEPITDAAESDAAESDDRPGLLRRVVAAIKGYPTGWIIDRKFTAEHWAEGTMHAYGDNAGALAMAGMLPDRWVLVVHGREHGPCRCSHDDYTVTHVDYFSVTGATYQRFSIGDAVTEADRIIDID